jgi:hypothetical protein
MVINGVISTPAVFSIDYSLFPDFYILVHQKKDHQHTKIKLTNHTAHISCEKTQICSVP